MPQRFLRPQIRQSKRWNRVPFFEQSLFVRLITIVDDFARYEADPELIRSEAFPFGDPKGRTIPLITIASALTALEDAGMLVLYEVEGTKYLQLSRWQERARTEASRFPAPCKHLLSDVVKCSLPKPSPSPSPSPTAISHKPEPSPMGVSKFVPPTKPEMELYAAKIGLPDTEVEKFLNFYESKGWFVGKSKMRSWQASARNWKINIHKYEQHQANGRNGRQIVDRNKGTANEGGAAQYANAAVNKKHEA